MNRTCRHITEAAQPKGGELMVGKTTVPIERRSPFRWDAYCRV